MNPWSPPEFRNGNPGATPFAVQVASPRAPLCATAFGPTIRSPLLLASSDPADRMVPEGGQAEQQKETHNARTFCSEY